MKQLLLFEEVEEKKEPPKVAKPIAIDEKTPLDVINYNTEALLLRELKELLKNDNRVKWVEDKSSWVYRTYANKFKLEKMEDIEISTNEIYYAIFIDYISINNFWRISIYKNRYGKPMGDEEVILYKTYDTLTAKQVYDILEEKVLFYVKGEKN